MPRSVALDSGVLRGATAKELAAACQDAGAWPLERERARSLLSSLRRLRLPQRDGSAHVLDEASRPRVARTIELLGERLDWFEIQVAAGSGARRTNAREIGPAALADLVRTRGLPPGATFEVVGGRHTPPTGPPDVAGTAAVDAAWERIERWLDDHHPQGARVLADGAAPAAIDELEEHVGRALPAALRHSLLRHDGQHDLGDATTTITDDKWLLSAQEIARDWDVWQDVAARFDDPEDVWPRARISFAVDDSAGGLALDREDATGEPDDAVLVYTKGLRPRQVAPRYESWLTQWADELESGAQVLDPDTGGIVAAWLLDGDAS